MTPYSGMLPGHIAGFYTRDECHIDLVALCRFAGVRFVHAAAVGIHPDPGGDGGTVLLDGRPGLRYDVLSVNTGSSPQLDAAARSTDGGGAGITVTPVKPIDGVSARWDRILDRVRAAAKGGGDGAPGGLTIAVVGGGAGGVELALSMQAPTVSAYLPVCVYPCILLSVPIRVSSFPFRSAYPACCLLHPNSLPFASP